MTFVELPLETITAVGGIVLAVLGLIVRWLRVRIPWLGAFLEQYKTEWGMALSASLVVYIQNILPGAELAGVSVLAVQLVVAIILYALGKVGLAKAGFRSFQ